MRYLSSVPSCTAITANCPCKVAKGSKTGHALNSILNDIFAVRVISRLAIGLVLHLSLFSFLTILPILQLVGITNAYAHSSHKLSQLEITDIKTYDYDTTSLEDYHPNQKPLTEVHVGSRFAINGLVKNQNHTAEHFDYITQVIDTDGVTIHLNIRNGVAVPLGRQIPIDSEITPIILNNTGTYLIKVFAWRNVTENPVPLSHAAVGVVRVIP